MMNAVRWLLVTALLLTGCARQQRGMTVGVCEDYPEETRSLSRVEEDLRIAREAGARVIRVGIGWDGIESERGVEDWTFWDAFIDRCERNHIELIPYLCYTPKWASAKPDAEDYWRQPPADVRMWSRFVESAARRYRGRVKTWELWNEPDNKDYWRGSVAQFAELVHAGSDAVRRGDPETKVVLGGIASDPGFIERLLREHNTARDIDIINVHAYFETWSPRRLEDLPALIDEVSAIASRYGEGEPVWLAETGYSSFRRGEYVSDWYKASAPFEHTDAFQGEALLRTMALAASTGQVRVFAWYRLRDLPSTEDIIGDVNNRHLGLLSPAGQPKPALGALSRAARLFGGETVLLEGVADLTAGTDHRAFVFTNAPDHAFLVAWVPILGKESIRLRLELPGKWRTVGPAILVKTRKDRTEVEAELRPDKTLIVELAR